MCAKNRNGEIVEREEFPCDLFHEKTCLSANIDKTKTSANRGTGLGDDVSIPRENLFGHNNVSAQNKCELWNGIGL